MFLCFDSNDKSIKTTGVDSKFGIPNFLSKSDFVIFCTFKNKQVDK